MNSIVLRKMLIMLIASLFILSGCSSQSELPIEDLTANEVLEVDKDLNKDFIEKDVEVVPDDKVDEDALAIIDDEEVLSETDDIQSTSDNGSSLLEKPKDKITNNSKPNTAESKEDSVSKEKPEAPSKYPEKLPGDFTEKAPEKPNDIPTPPIKEPERPVVKPSPPVDNPTPPTTKPKPPVVTPPTTPVEDVYTTECTFFPAPTETWPDGDLYVGEERKVPGRDGEYCNEYKNGIFYRVTVMIDPIAHKIYRGAKKPIVTGYKDAIAAEMMNWINEHRVKNGLPKYQKDSTLDKYTALRAKEIATDFSHNSKGNYRKFFEYENIAAGTHSIAFDNWVGSPLHNYALLDPLNYQGSVSVYLHSNGVIYIVFANNRKFG